MHILTLFGWRVAKKGVSSLGALILLRAGYEPKCSLCLEDSAMAAEGSGAELKVSQRIPGSDDPWGSPHEMILFLGTDGPRTRRQESREISRPEIVLQNRKRWTC